ncbi:hypothetical protein [Actinomyces qiguomingii]|uniref:hypothetical protein n=1 Tax=Actinomyces qiguomingii TaxID=2057800 RepID=UPI000FFF663B|nr:hypothetical protein [Actinomyces qiguomingii]
MATVQTKTANVSGIAVQVPSTWVSHPHTSATGDEGGGDDPWALDMTNPDGDAEPVLAVSDVLPTSSTEQAYQAASALLSSSIPGYQAVGAFTFPTSPQPELRQPTPSPSAQPTPAVGIIARIAFTYERGDAESSGTAWIVPANGGYVVVALTCDDDATLAAIETSLTGDGA